MRRGLILTLVVIGVIGAIAVVAMAAGGPEPRGRWGYIAGTLAFVLSAAQLAPALAFATRVGRGFWSAPLRRLADVFAVTGLVTAPLTIVLVFQLPDWRGRPSIWFDWPGAPGVWDSAASIVLAATGLGLVWLSTWPEHHAARWCGSRRQWQMLTRGLTLLGALYAMLAVFVHLLISSDLAVSLVSGWHSAVLPAYHVISGLEAAVALLVIALAILRTPRPADTHAAFAACTRLLLALSLLWFYLVWCELLTDWYGRTPDEQGVLSLFMFGPGATLFVVAAACEFVIPLLVLMWKGARDNVALTTAVAVVVLVGSYFDRLRLYVGAWSVATPTPEEHLADNLPLLAGPGLPELAACAGILALSALTVVIAVGRVAPVAAWEVRAVNRLTPARRLLRARVDVVARPS